MERNDAVMPMVAIVVAAIMWVLMLFMFAEDTKVPAVKVSPELTAAAAAEWPTLGAQVYIAEGCVGCHGANGEGGAGPALAGNERLLENPTLAISTIQKGKGIMPAYPQLNENQVLAVTNYVLNSFGNSHAILGPEILQAAVSNVTPEVLRVRSRFVPDHINLVQIFLGSFVMTLLMYGVIGLYSVWAEGVELKPGIHKVRSTPMAVLAMVVVLLSAVVFSILFAYQIVSGLIGLNADPPLLPVVTLEGFYAAGIMLSLAAALGIYKKYFMDGEALIEDASGEFPW